MFLTASYWTVAGFDEALVQNGDIYSLRRPYILVFWP